MNARSSAAARCLLGALLLPTAAGCSGAGWQRVLDPSDIVELSEGSPKLSRTRDLGTIHLGKAGPLAPESDGDFTVGELMLIEGRGFGKQPTVQLGGRPVEVLWRTAGGGIIARVPAGVPSGVQPLRVQAGGAVAEGRVPVRRLGLVLDTRAGVLHAVVVGGGPGAAPQVGSVGQPRPAPGAKAVMMAQSGAAAYVLSAGPAGDRVGLIDVGAPGGPRQLEVRDLTHGAYAIAAAERAPVVAFVGEDHVTLWDTSEGRRPAPYAAARLPAEAKGARAAALDPSGTLLALAVPEGNRVVLVDVKPGPRGVRAVFVAEAQVLREARQPLLADLRFSSDGETLWVLSGDLAEGQKAGHQPTRLHQLHVGAPEASTEVGRTQRELLLEKTAEVADAGAPVQLQLARALPVASGATIRTPPDKATLYLSTVSPEALGAAAGAAPPLAGALLRSDGSGQASPLYSGGELLGGVDLTPDGTVALVGQASAGREGLAALVAHTEMVSTISLPLGAATAKDLRPPYPATKVALQP